MKSQRKDNLKKKLLTKEILFLTAIFLLAFFLRIYKLGGVPYGFHADEVDAGYIGRYILLHGYDIMGNPLPIFFDKFGDFRPTGIYYLSGLSTFIFGINEFAVRFPSAFFGALTAVSLYFFSLLFWRNKKTAFISAFTLAVFPWHIVLSRATSESVIGLFFLISGFTFLFYSLKTKKTLYFIISGVFLLLPYFFYHSFRLLTPILIVPFIFYPGIASSQRKKIIIFLAFFIVITALFGLSKAGSGRFSQVAFFNNPNLANTQEVLISGEGNSHITQARIFHNKGIIFGHEFLTQYLSYYSPQFLFLSGGLPYRYTVPETGLLYVFFAPIILLSFLYLRNEKSWNIFFVLFLFIIATFPAALTFEDSPNIQRSVVFILPLTLLVAYGIYALLFSLTKNKTAYILFTLILIFTFATEFTYFFHQYLQHASLYKSYLRNDGNKELMNFVLQNKNKYTTIYMPNTDDHALYYLFYKNDFDVPTSIFKKENRVSQIDNISFKENTCPLRAMNTKIIMKEKFLLVDDGNCAPDLDLKLVKEIPRKDSTIAYRLYTNAEKK